MESSLSKSDIKRHADRQELANYGAALGQMAGLGGAFFTQSYLGKKLREQHHPVPAKMFGTDIKDLRTNINAGLNKAIDKDVVESIERRLGKRGLSKKELQEGIMEVRKEMLELGDLGESFLKERGLRDAGIKVNLGGRGKLGDYYNPIKNSVNLSTANPAVALHEMGHAADIKGSALKTIGRHLPLVAASMAVPLAYGAGEIIKEKIPGTVDDKVIDFIQEHPVALMTGAYGINTLYPEAKASYLALKHIANQRGSEAMWSAAKKSLAPAFGTYLAGALPIAGAAMGTKMLYDYAIKNQHKKHASSVPESFRAGFEKKSFDLKNTAKAFGIGAATLGIPAAALSYYMLKNKAAKDIGAVQNESYRRQLEAQGVTPAMRDLLVKSNRSMNNWQVDNPELATALAAGVTGALGGAMTAYYMEGMD